MSFRVQGGGKPPHSKARQLLLGQREFVRAGAGEQLCAARRSSFQSLEPEAAAV